MFARGRRSRVMRERAKNCTVPSYYAGFPLAERLLPKDDDRVDAAIQMSMTIGEDDDDDDEEEDLTNSQQARDEDQETKEYVLQDSITDHLLVTSVLSRQIFLSSKSNSRGTREKIKLVGESLLMWLIVYCVFAMQIGIIYKLHTITHLQDAMTTDKIFGSRGVCVKMGVRTEDIGWFPNLVLNCNPPPLNFAEHWSNLDRNNDGIWTEEEAVEAEKEFPRVKSTLLFFHFNEKIKEHDQTGKWKNLTNDYTKVPKEAYNGKGGVLTESMKQLCSLLDYRMCSNMEIDHTLVKIFSSSKYKHPSNRIDRCEEILKGECDVFGGESYKMYQTRHSELCGEYQIAKVTKNGVRQAQFSEVVRYNNDQDGVRTPNFFMFLVIILAIWLMTLFTEIKNCQIVMQVFFFFPVASYHVLPATGSPVGQMTATFGSFSSKREDEGDDEPFDLKDTHTVLAYREVEGDEFTILQWQDPLHKWLLILLLQLPRTIILIFIAVVGTNFLTTNFGYIDLILNAVALGFLVDVDKIVFAALASTNRKILMSRVKPLQFYDHELGEEKRRYSKSCKKRLKYWLNRFLHWFMGITNLNTSTYRLTFMVFFIACIVTLQTVYKSGGLVDTANALNCMCQQEGKYCENSSSFSSEITKHENPLHDLILGNPVSEETTMKTLGLETITDTLKQSGLVHQSSLGSLVQNNVNSGASLVQNSGASQNVGQELENLSVQQQSQDDIMGQNDFGKGPLELWN